jgi:phosphoribosyl-ATP pyrophosphohydrolase/phosphoribosyl-AMP cyclohydrolase/histidinol dehydrogenase
MTAQLRVVTAGDLPGLLSEPVDAETLAKAGEIVRDVRERGEDALLEYCQKFGDIPAGTGLVFERDQLEAAFEELPEQDQELLKRTAARIRTFAKAQRGALSEMTMEIPGGQAGHEVSPVESAGCYAPGGAFPLPSSVLMTAVTARAAGVERVVVASPKAARITLAAAHAAEADMLIQAGGAHAIAAMAYGAGPVPACDVIVGPGSKWVTAAKQLVCGQVGIDMLAGPSELVVLADNNADPKVIAADLLAQAEHGYDSLPVLVTTSEEIIARTNAELERQLETLPTRDTAAASVAKGYAVLAADLNEAVAVIDRIAPEHLELLLEDAPAVAGKLKHYGALFVGAGSAEVLGDYGAGPNHTLPTGGTARFTGGLSVFDFLRIRTWMRIDSLADARELVEDARDLARHEALEGHARSAEQRLVTD